MSYRIIMYINHGINNFTICYCNLMIEPDWQCNKYILINQVAPLGTTFSFGQ